MTSVGEFLAHLRSLDIRLWAEDGRLRYDAPTDALTPALRAELMARKAEILTFLTAVEAAPRVNAALIQPAPRAGDAPLSFAQERLWFLDQLAPGSPFYVMPAAVRLVGALDRAALARSLNEIVRRHEVLRTTFRDLDGKPAQVIAPALTLPLPLTDLSALPEPARAAEVRRLATENATQPFDLARGPLLRAALLRLGEQVYVLLLALHHIASDGWSVGVFVRELTAIYDAFAADRPSPLPDLPLQYADFAAWQRDWLRGDLLQGQLDYWRAQLTGSSAVLALPTDRPRPPVQSFRGAHHAFILAEELTAQLNALSRQEGATLFMTLLAAFQTLLYRYTGHERINIGSPIANRTRAEIEGLIGFFVNTLVLCTELGGNPTFRGLLGRVRQVALDAFAHQDLPFEMLVEALRPERDLSHTPLFQAMFVLQNAPAAALRLAGLTVETLPLESPVAKFDLTLSMTEEAGRLHGVLEYNTDLFDAETIARLAGHLETLLAGLAADPDGRLADLPLLTEAERRQLLVEWNATDAPYPADRCIHELFEAWAARTPDAPAVAFQGQTLTYAELDRRANQLAHYLQRRGVGPETIVGLCVERSPEMIVGLLGILKTGAAYLPLDPTYPPDRLAFMLADAGVTVLLTAEHPSSFILPPSSFILLDADWPLIAQEPPTAPTRAVTPENLAYVIYTSGSTGQPKGVLVEHRGLVNVAEAQARCFGFGPGDRLWQFASLSFDAATFEIVLALCHGATLCLPTRDDLLPGPDLVRYLRDEAITAALMIPSALAATPFADLPDLHTLMVAGEACSAELVAQWAPGRRFFNLYGPTETTIWATVAECSDGSRPPPIGRPIINTQLYVLDTAGQPVPIGVPGELYIGGAGGARGYLNRPELTAERFIPAPFRSGRSPTEPFPPRLYRTGDLVRYLPDGNLEFLGRLDQQVKVRGFRIELGEIEAVLGQHPGVREAVVVARDEPAGKRLVAYVVPASDSKWGERSVGDRLEQPRELPVLGPVSDRAGASDPTALGPVSDRASAAELRRFLAARLPDYMLPAAFVMLDRLPIAPSGKLDRGALPAPAGDRPESERAYIAPRTPVEQTLTAIWAELLGVTQVGIHDNFFELGGHSLLATQAISRTRNAFRLDLPLQALFAHPTVADLAAEIEALLPAARGAALPAIAPYPRDSALPLSFAQERLWFLDQLEPGSAAYNIPTALRLTGALDVAALAHSLNEIVHRHEALRTTFRTVEGKPAQVIAPAVAFPLPVTDLTGLPEAEAEAQRLAAEDAARPFDLAAGPLWRAALLRLDEQVYVLLLTMHHSVSDGWSVGVFVRELTALYAAFVAGRPSPLPDLPLQYADFAAWQRGWLQGETLAEQLAYWRGQLAGSPAMLTLPTDRPRPAVQTFRGAHHGFVLPAPLTGQINALSRQEGATLFMTLLAAFQTLLYRYTGQERINVGSPIANRNRAEIEGLIGFFVNTLVLSADLSGNPTFRALLGRVREVALAAYRNQDLPFEMLVDELRPERDLSHGPLFQVAFALQNTPLDLPRLPGVTVCALEIESHIAKFDLTLTLVERGDGLHGVLEYNSDLFDAATIERMAGHFTTLLTGIVADPDRQLTNLPLLTEAEQRQLLVEWNATAAPFPADRCIHELFEAQVACTPDAPAITFQGQTLTYTELDRRANQLAHHLQRRGVGPEILVGLCVERSPEMIVGLLGILKAGGAYLPLDPTYPPDRLAFMLADAGVGVVLTDERRRTNDEHLAAFILHPSSFILLDADWPLIAQEPPTAPPRTVTPGNLAYVIYTSGSTGRPKGVPVEHRGLCNVAEAQRQLFGIGPGDRLLQFFSLSFDASAFEIILALCHGATLCLAARDDVLPGPNLIRSLREQAITAALIMPSALAATPFADLPDLHTLMVGGEACPAEVVGRWAAGRRFFNLYGPTETTIWSTAARCTDGSRIPPIGRPILNTQVYVLDARRQPVPIGVPGELYIGGVGVARGYLGRKDEGGRMKDEGGPFILHPSSFILYRTGDLVRYRADGNLEFLGRLDQQVKVRGFRIELGEIEVVLGQHPGVQEAVVVARDEPAGKRLVAYIVPASAPKWGGRSVGDRREQPSELGPVSDRASAAQPSEWGERSVGDRLEQPSELGPVSDRASATELRRFLAARLPDYMLPAAFVTLPRLPLTPSGKLDRSALPAPEGGRPDLAQGYIAPRTPAEQTLAAIWAELLRLPQVGVRDNFFELGGDSILSIQVIARANQAGLRLTTRQLFQFPTVESLAAVAGAVPEPPLGPVPDRAGVSEGSLPLTPIQHWFFEQDFPDPHHWNQSLLLEVRRPLDPALLERALGALLAHHDVLRLRFTRDADGWQQISAAPDAPPPFTVIDLAGLPPEAQLAALEAAAAQIQASLNLAAGPLMRSALVDLGPGRPGRFLWIIHHLAVDAVSWRILLEDLQTAYRQLSRGEAVALPPKTTAYKQWIERLRAHAQTAGLVGELDYWLAGAQAAVPLPLDHPADRSANTVDSAARIVTALSAERTASLLHDALRSYNTQINDLLLAALAQTLTDWAGGRAVRLDLESHGREELFEGVDLSRTVGWCTALYPVRLELPAAAGPGEIIKSVKEQLRRVPGRGIGYGLLRYLNDDAEIRTRLQVAGQAEVIFNYLGQFDPSQAGLQLFDLAQEAGGPQRSPRGQRSHLLEITGSVTAGRLQMTWTYSERFHRRATIERLAASFMAALEGLIEHCLSPGAGGHTPSDFPAARLSQGQLDKLIAQVGRPRKR